MRNVKVTEMACIGEYLLKVLDEKKCTLYSESFFNDTQALADRLSLVFDEIRAATGPKDSHYDKDDLEIHFPIYIDNAVYQLEDEGLVVTRQLDERTLIDGERDYEIRLTKKGKAFLRNGARFDFRNCY